MEFKVLTLRYSPVLGALDDTPLLALARDHEVLGVREHFFVVHDTPHLVCLVSCQPRTTQVIATTTAATALPKHPAEPPARPEPAASPSPHPELTPDQHRLYESIRRWRFEAAQRDGVPAYVVLTNRDVLTLVHEHPTSLTALGRVRGIGKAKLERYGAALLALLHGDPPTTAGPTLVPTPAPNDPPPAAITADA